MTAMAKARGHRVTGLDIGYFESCRRAGADEILPDRQTFCDIRDVTPADLDGVEAIIHLAGLSNDPIGELNPALTRRINLEATARIGALAKAAGVERFVFASSCSIYGAAGGDTALDEAAPTGPVSAYAVSKLEAETALAGLADDRFSPVFMRNATAFGIGVRPRFDLVVNNLVGWAAQAGAINIMSDGSPWRPLAHIEDISLAALCAAEAPRHRVHREAFNIGRADCNYRVRDIAEAVQAAFPKAKVKVNGEGSADPRSYRVEFSKALGGLPGFEPRWTLAMGVAEAAAWLADGGLQGEDFQSRRFVRLKQLKHGLDTGLLDQDLRFTRGKTSAGGDEDLVETGLRPALTNESPL
jgi:nucleoside-diphosphate-sugar epimerase